VDRKQLKSVEGLITGHSNLKVHLYKLELADNPKCNNTAFHILCYCDVPAGLRYNHSGAHFESTDYH